MKLWAIWGAHGLWLHTVSNLRYEAIEKLLRDWSSDDTWTQIRKKYGLSAEKVCLVTLHKYECEAKLARESHAEIVRVKCEVAALKAKLYALEGPKKIYSDKPTIL